VTSASAAARRRAGGPDDAVAGVVPAEVVEPATLDEAAETVAACARDRRRLVFAGGGTELGLGAPPEGLDLVLRTGSCRRVVEHAPLDQIVTVECGVRLADLQAALAAHGQMLAADPPWADRATVGGIVATGAFGPRRARYGAVRDLIIGVSFVRADGARARGGGKVVKNVAGFDLPKLMAGSLGTLGLIATVTFRLHPLPEATGTVLFSGAGAPVAQRVMATVRAAQLEPDAAAVLLGGGDDDSAARAELGVRFAGFAPAVETQCRRLLAVASELGAAAELLDQAGAAGFWMRHEAARAAPAELRAKIALLPADPSFEELWLRLARALRQARAVLYPTLGLAFVAGGVERADALARAVAEARALAAGRGGSIVLHDAPASLRALVDVWGAPPSALPLMRSVKQRLDPDRILAPGRFVAGI
jgi:glycolate oxidase FAD binding subunit